jgi:hypothetical protein
VLITISEIWLQQTRTQTLITQEKRLPQYGYNDNLPFLVITSPSTLYCHNDQSTDNFLLAHEKTAILSQILMRLPWTPAVFNPMPSRVC